MVITIDDEEEDQEVRKKPIVTAQDDGEEEEPPAKKHKLCRDLLKRLPPFLRILTMKDRSVYASQAEFKDKSHRIDIQFCFVQGKCRNDLKEIQMAH